MALQFPPNPIVGDIYTFGSIVYRWNGTSWDGSTVPTSAIDALTTTVSQKASNHNPALTGSISITPSTSSDGIKVADGYAWIDLIGDVSPKSSGANSAGWDLFSSNFRAWSHAVNTNGQLQYHVPHEYAVGTDVFLHLHWGHQGTGISGSFVVDFQVSVVSRTLNDPAPVIPVPSTISLTVSNLNITNSPQHCHRVDEIQLSNNGGTGGLINTANIGVDSLIIIYYTINTIPSITGGAKNLPFIFTADLHMQTNNIGTKNKAPNFYL